MNLSTVLLLLIVTLFLILILHTEETESLYPYTIRGFVTDVRSHPFRFIGGLFFKKAFLLKKLKLKWKLKKKFVLKKLLKKLFLGWKLGLKLKSKSLLPHIFAQLWGYTGPPYYRGTWGGTSNIPPQFYHQQRHPQHLDLKTVYHQHHHFYGSGSQEKRAAALRGRKRRAVRFPDEDANGSSSSGGGSSPFVRRAEAQYDHHQHQQHHPQQQSSSRTFFDDEEFSEFRSIGLGQQELEMLRQLPENLQFEYRQEMQDLETSSSEPREKDIMEYLTVTNEFDSDHCIAKGICEVMARGNRTGNQFENLLLEYYNEEPEARKDPNGAAAYIYDYAAFLGKSRRDSRACASYFPKCPEPTTRLTSFMNDIFSSEMCDPPVHNEL